MTPSQLVTWEQHAQQGVLQFAEGMQHIRDEGLYPGAKTRKDAWKTYCQDRWRQSKSSVDGTILAIPLLRRLSLMHEPLVHGSVSITVASRIATLPESVQDAILAETTNDKSVQAKAKAARAVAKKAKNKGIEVDPADMIAAAMKAKPPKKAKPRAKMAPADVMQPVFDDPRDHGCRPRKLKREAVHADWRAYEALKDTALQEDDAQAILGMIERHRRILDLIESVVSGEGQVTDEALAELLEEAS